MAAFRRGTAVAALGFAWAELAAQDPSPLVEETLTRLVQVDVTVHGAREIVPTLERDDFRLKVHMRWLDDFTLDRHCTPPDEGEIDSWQAALRPAVSYLFFFDQPHLTLAGRARAMDIARELARRLVIGGNQAIVVSNARRLAVIEELTDDPERVVAALDRLENDRTQWDFYATEEDSRVANVVDYLNKLDNVHGAVGAAKTYQREELARADRSLRRLSMTLGRLTEATSRKAVIYFADTMRQNPGEHYLTFFSTSMQRGNSTVSDIASSAFMSHNVFDKVVNEATAHGIRFYTVMAQGLVTPFDRSAVDAGGVALTGAAPMSAQTRFRDAQSTLGNLATETGGRVYVRGENSNRIAAEIREDFGCLYTLSFDPEGFAEDSPLRVIVETDRPGVELSTRGRLVVQSDSAIRTSRLLRAFAIGEEGTADLALQAHLIPTHFDGGNYRALLQLTVPATAIPAVRWELGASLIDRDTVRDEVSGSLSVRRGGVPLVLEHEVTIRPGPQEIIAVAHEETTDFLLSEHVQLSWPDPDARPATCSPLALLQPTVGAFVRDGVSRTRGSLAHAPGATVRPELPTALMGLVCRGRRDRGLLQVERTLVGASAVDFPPLSFRLEHERCAQVRDLIPAGSLGPGGYVYRMRVRNDTELLHEVSIDFVAAETEP